MANELKTFFIFDSETGNRNIEVARKNLFALNNEVNNLGKNLTVGKTISEDFTKAGRAADSFQNKVKDTFKAFGDEAVKSAQAEKVIEQAKRATLQTQAEQIKLERQQIALKRDQLKLQQQISGLKSKPDPGLKTAAADIKHYQQQIIQGEKAVTSAVEREAKRQADARIREGKRAANEAIRSLNQKPGGGDSFGSSFAGRAGLSLQSATFGGVVGGLAGGAAAIGISEITSVLKTGGAAWLDYSSKLEQAKIGFTTILGSAELADRHLKELQSFAKTTPFEFGDLTAASQKLQGVGIESKRVIPILTDVGNALAAAGKGNEEIQRTVLALTQISAKGKLAAQEVNQLAENGIPAWQILSKELGISKAEVIKLAENGKISSKIFLEAFHRFSETNFGGAMEKQSKTFQGAMSNIKDSLLITSQTAFEPLYNEISKFTVNFATALNDGQPTLKNAAESLGVSVGISLRDGIKKGLTREGLQFIIQSLMTNPIQDVGVDFAVGTIKGAFENKQLSTSDLRKLDDKIGGISNSVNNLPAIGDKLKAGEAAKEAEKLIDINRRMALSFAEQKLSIQKANRSDSSIENIRADAIAEQAIIREQIRLSAKAASDKIKNLSDEDFNAGKGRDIVAENLEVTNRLNAQLVILGINAQKQIDQIIEAGKAKVKELGKEFNAVFDNLFQKTGANNPFASVFSEGDKALKALRENLRGLIPELQNVALQMQSKLNANALFETRLDNALEVFDLRSRASQFRNAGQSEAEKKRFEEIARRGVFAGDFNSLSDDEKRASYERRLIASNDFAVNPNLIGALASDRLRGNNPNQSVSDRLQSQIKILDSFASTDEEKAGADRRLVSLTAGVNPNDLNPQLREKVATANERLADRREKYEQEALKIEREKLELEKQTAENTKKLLELVEKQGLKGLEVILKNETNGAASATVSPTAAPTASDTANQYGGNLNYGSSGGFSNR